ncbi:MAG: hypothetical protein MJK04_09460 [Psychrosphaera sp.]|nr:hypothetical protein [Psychrosphaera sp.]
MNKKILLIGGTGIVGTAMMKAAIEKNYHITVITNNDTEVLPQGVVHITGDKQSPTLNKPEKGFHSLTRYRPETIVYDSFWSKAMFKQQQRLPVALRLHYNKLKWCPFRF